VRGAVYYPGQCVQGKAHQMPDLVGTQGVPRGGRTHGGMNRGTARSWSARGTDEVAFRSASFSRRQRNRTARTGTSRQRRATGAAVTSPLSGGRTKTTKAPRASAHNVSLSGPSVRPHGRPTHVSQLHEVAVSGAIAPSSWTAVTVAPRDAAPFRRGQASVFPPFLQSSTTRSRATPCQDLPYSQPPPRCRNQDDGPTRTTVTSPVSAGDFGRANANW